jgi:SAM-dependent methyltransferase
MNQFSESFWTERYQTNEATWDAGSITEPLKAFVDQLTDKNIKILVPGAGNGHEAEYLFNNGFKNVFVIDISSEPINNIKKRVPAFPETQLITGDFFAHKGQYDLIIEQTFFCALDPALQAAYAPQMQKLLKPGAKLIGVLFIDPLNSTTPPFAITKEEYITLFQPYLQLQKLEICYNSIKPRQNRELFIIAEKRS